LKLLKTISSKTSNFVCAGGFPLFIISNYLNLEFKSSSYLDIDYFMYGSYVGGLCEEDFNEELFETKKALRKMDGSDETDTMFSLTKHVKDKKSETIKKIQFIKPAIHSGETIESIISGFDLNVCSVALTILDKTHLTFFVSDECYKVMEDGFLRIQKEHEFAIYHAKRCLKYVNRGFKLSSELAVYMISKLISSYEKMATSPTLIAPNNNLEKDGLSHKIITYINPYEGKGQVSYHSNLETAVNVLQGHMDESDLYIEFK
jgi:hypothetical protein